MANVEVDQKILTCDIFFRFTAVSQIEMARQDPISLECVYLGLCVALLTDYFDGGSPSRLGVVVGLV